MRIQSSHLALRFYKHDGWTKEILEACLDNGEIEFCEGNLLNYWRLKFDSTFKVDKLIKYVSSVERWSNHLDKLSDKEYIEHMNW